MQRNEQQRQALARLEQGNTADWQAFKGLLQEIREETRKQLELCADVRLMRQLQGKAQLLADLDEQFSHARKR